MSRASFSTSKEKVIADLKRLAKKLGKSPTWIEFDNLSEIPLSSVTKNFGTLNKALIAAELPINRKGTRKKRPKGYQRTNKPSCRRRPEIHGGHQPVFTFRNCNVCERKFQAEDDMRSCPFCTTTKRSAESRGGFVDSNYGTGYLI